MSEGTTDDGFAALLERARSGDERAHAELAPLVYDELRAIAARAFRRQQSGHTLQPTVVAHEAYMRLIQAEGTDVRGRAHFMAIAATAMRQILTDHARKRRAAKRGGDWDQVTLTGLATDASAQQTLDALALDEALTRLAEQSPRVARLVELRVLGGLTVPEAAEVLEVSPRTVDNDWRFARAWLRRELQG